MLGLKSQTRTLSKKPGHIVSLISSNFKKLWVKILSTTLVNQRWKENNFKYISNLNYYQYKSK